MDNVIIESKSKDFKKLPGSFWVITSFYNPSNTKNKLVNYKYFRKKLREQGVKLLTVECAFKNKNFSLGPGDADKIIQVRSSSVLWQKERLLNIALDNLPSDCDKIAWLDADVLILDDKWEEKVSALLEKYHLVKPFTEAVRLNDSETKKVLHGKDLEKYELMNSKDIHGYYSPKQEKPLVYLAALGMCARRIVFKDSYFYDKMILGSGDLIMANVFLASNCKVEDIDISEYFSLSLKVDINNWYKKFTDKNGQVSIGRLDALSLHLFHGLTTNRSYKERQSILKKNNYEPVKDLNLNEYGCFEWSSNKRGLKNEVLLYFKSRNEDNKAWNNIRPYSKRLYIKHKQGLVRKIKTLPVIFSRLTGLVGVKISMFSPVMYKLLKKAFKSKS